MRELKWNEYVNELSEERKKLQDIIKKAKKKHGESVDYSYVHQAEQLIEEFKQYEMDNVLIWFEIEPVSVKIIYNIEDLEEKQAFQKCKEDCIEIIYNKNEVVVKKILEIKHIKYKGLGNLYNVYVLNEAATLWGIDEGTIRKAIKSHKFKQFGEVRKAGRITLITDLAMKRVFGKR